MSVDLALLGADTANQQAGGGSFFDNTVMFTGSAVLSGLAGIYNTFVDYGSKLGVDADQIDTSRVLENYDQNWYNYYKEHQQLVDTAGFVASSFIPGTLAIKGLKAAQAARATGAIGRAVTGTLNFANAKRDAALAAGLEEMAREGGSAFAYINANKLAAMSWGFADQALQAGAFETAVALTMKQSPLLADKGGLEMLSDIGFGMVVGGGFGGAIDAIATRKVFKNAVEIIGNKQRKFDALANYNDIGLGIGDEAYGLVDSLMNLPKETIFDDRFVHVLNPFNKTKQALDLEGYLSKTLDSTTMKGYNDLQKTLQKFGPDTGPAAAQLALDIVKQGIAEGHAPAEIKKAAGDYLLGMKSLRGLNERRAELNFQRDDLFYINHEVDLKNLPENATIEDFLSAARDRKPFEKNATAKPYEVIGDVANMKFTMSAKTFEEAWAAGNDMAVIGGKLRINPKSGIFQQTRDPNLIPTRFLNTRTQGVSDTTVATWADMLPAGAKATDKGMILDNGVSDGKRFIKLAGEEFPSDARTATARHAWAATRSLDYFTNRVVDTSDISSLERLRNFSKEELQRAGVKLQDSEGGISQAANVDLDRVLSQSKLNKIEEMMNDQGKMVDPREVAYVVNAPEEYIERALMNGFQRTSEDMLIEGMSKPMEANFRRENFLVTYASPRKLVDLGIVDADTLAATEKAATTKGAKYVDTFVTGDLGFFQRVALSQEARNNATTAVFGSEDAAKFIDPKDLTSRMANELGIGAGILSSSNANYGDKLKLWAQYTGGLTHQLIKKFSDVNMEKLQPYINKMKDNPKAGAELGIITSMLRRTPFKYVLAFDKDGVEKMVVRDATITGADGMRVVSPEKLEEWTKTNADKMVNGKPPQAIFQVENKDVLEFLHTWTDINADRISKRAVILNSRGGVLGWDPDVIYAPPIDTTLYPHFAFVKIKQGHVAGGSDVGMITAKDPEQLSKLINGVDREKYDVFTKGETEEFYRVKNEYDAQLTFNEPRVDSNLRREGKLGDFFYETRPQNVMEDFIRYSQHADSALVRHTVETKYAQLITELKEMGKQYTEVARSQASGLFKYQDRSAINPFNDYVLTALDISKRSSFPLIHQLNEFVDTLGTSAYRAFVANLDNAKKGIVSWEEAERLATKYGIGGVYNADNVATVYNIANRPADRNIIREAVSKLNMFLATAGLRLDFANSIVNTISMPIMLGTELASIRSLASKDPSAIGALSDLLNNKLTRPDGTVIQAPSYTKVIANAIKNVVGPGGKDVIEGYRRTGEVKSIMAQFHEMMDDLAIKPAIAPREWSKKIDGWIEKGSKWTGNNWAEDFTRAVSANVMDQMTAPLVAAKLMTSQEAAAYRSVFVNRVNGNYISSQRPILFQGTVGSAISLFQTYVFNVMQQLTRHIENRDTRALLTMGGLQGAIYGFNGLPFFDAVNTHLIGNASINDGHRDVYSYVTQLAGKELGDWLLYGTASALPIFGDKSPALYTRGDINPRHISVLPVSPLDIPAVEVTRRMVSNLVDVGSKIANGGALGASLLEGLEHNGVSRPLAGLAQLASQYTTTSKGSLISASNEFDLVTAATRIMGAKPMDEAIAMNAMYRQQAYKAADQERLNELGAAVKTRLRKNQMPTDEEMQQFMKQYASAGGNLQNYSSALQRWSRDANMSVVNQLKNWHNNQYAQRLTEIMGGTTLDDYRSPTAPASEQQQ